MRQIIYLIYYLKEIDLKKFIHFLEYARIKSGKNSFVLLMDVFFSIFRYNISIMDYFYFRFFLKDHNDRITWAGTGYMYEYQLKMNPKKTRYLLEDKIKFLNKYSSFINHSFLTLDELIIDSSKILKLINNKSFNVVFKDSLGQCGNGVKVMPLNSVNLNNLIHDMKKDGYNMVEEFINQHDELHNLSPSGLNTVRIFTQLDKQNNVTILGCRLRISINSTVDNLAAGNMAVVVDTHSGTVISEGVFSDITKLNCAFHPISGVQLKGFQVPFWKETINLVKKAALFDTSNRSVGWDIAITNEGPELIEGNHNWCKLLWQLPPNKGLKHLIDGYNV